MGKRRGAGSEAGALFIVVAVVVVIAAVPWEVWVSLVVIGLATTGAYFYYKQKAAQPTLRYEPTLEEIMAAAKPKAPPLPIQIRGAAVPKAPPPYRPQPPALAVKVRVVASKPNDMLANVSPPRRAVPVEALPEFRPAPHPQTTNKASSPQFSIPQPSVSYGKAQWIAPGDSVIVAGTAMLGGMLYVGSTLQGAYGDSEPSLINPRSNVAKVGDFTIRQMEYWPSYEGISASARRAYLNWLASGRNHPDCEIGFVFLFFYGLERRVIADSLVDPNARGDWPAITEDIRRLLSIYGEKSHSFRSYADALLNWMLIETIPSKLYDKPFPAFAQSYELPLYLRLALGQAAIDRAPLPALLAIAWTRLSPGIALRTPAKRCAEEFDRLFVQRYHEVLGSGLVLPKNRTKLKAVYRPASGGLRGCNGLIRSFGDIPDITVLTEPLKTLQTIGSSCTDELDAFSRSVGKDPNARNTLIGLIQLPVLLWPNDARQKLQTLTDRVQGSALTLPFKEVLATFGDVPSSLSRDKICGVARILETSGIAMEPNVLSGAKPPLLGDPVVLFRAPSKAKATTESGAYNLGMLTLQLASAAAHADGDFSAREVNYLRREINGWIHLEQTEQDRLQAHLQLLIVAPIPLISLKKKLELLDKHAKESVAALVVTLAQADGIVTPAEIKFLEKVYKILGVEAKRVFSDVHAASSGKAIPINAEKSVFKLDSSRIMALQRDTEKVTALLAGIFMESEAPVSAEPKLSEILDADETTSSTCILGLDEAHSTLVRLIWSRPQWTRDELEDAAADLKLMLDGSLERINEEFFDAYDMPFTEGDDPIDVNTEAMEKIRA